jgi:4-carboxymuconolactone decarboxylase
MSTPKPASSARNEVRQVVPRLIELTGTLLCPDIWERPGLSERDRSLITMAWMALHRPDQLKVHTERARANGVTREEVGEIITHLACHGGWPGAMSAARVARQVFEEKPA